MKCVLRSIFVVLFFPAAAHTNAGVPMIFLSYPVMFIALLPVIFIETGIFLKSWIFSFFCLPCNMKEILLTNKWGCRTVFRGLAKKGRAALLLIWAVAHFHVDSETAAHLAPR